MDAEPAAGELITSAIRHAPGACGTTLRMSGQEPTITVRGGSTEQPAPKKADPHRIGGHGPHLVQTVGEKAVVALRATGKLITAHLPVAPPNTGSPLPRHPAPNLAAASPCQPSGRRGGTAVLPHVVDGGAGCGPPTAPGAGFTAVATAQVREVVERLIAAGRWHETDPEMLVVLGSGYDALRIAHLPAGPPVEILGRLRSDRVVRRPTPPRVHDPKGGRPPKHGSQCRTAPPSAR
ncbi:transposase [Streptomyces sp. NPDC014676]|uniref:transposase n=1 Tax=Streptomyces sp. NPDC014676 TaxID=3364879 RepID=UPI0036F80A6A